MGKVITQNDNISLRTWLPQDDVFFYELNRDEDVIRYTGDPPFHSISEARHFILSYQDFERFGCGRWLVTHNHSRETLGWCGIKFHPDTGLYDLGFRFMKKYWNRGWATMASSLCLDYAEQIMHLKVLTARAMNENLASQRVLAKLDFQLSGETLEEGKIWLNFVKTF